MTPDPKAKHTWNIVYNGNAEEALPAIIEGEHLRITVDHGENFGDPLPVALLIAAAPELLEALTDFEYWAKIPDNGSKDAVLLRNRVRLLIAKATGGKDE